MVVVLGAPRNPPAHVPESPAGTGAANTGTLSHEALRLGMSSEGKPLQVRSRPPRRPHHATTQPQRISARRDINLSQRAPGSVAVHFEAGKACGRARRSRNRPPFVEGSDRAGCLLVAQSGHYSRVQECPLLSEKQTFRAMPRARGLRSPAQKVYILHKKLSPQWGFMCKAGQ